MTQFWSLCMYMHRDITLYTTNLSNFSRKECCLKVCLVPGKCCALYIWHFYLYGNLELLNQNILNSSPQYKYILFTIKIYIIIYNFHNIICYNFRNILYYNFHNKNPIPSALQRHVTLLIIWSLLDMSRRQVLLVGTLPAVLALYTPARKVVHGISHMKTIFHLVHPSSVITGPLQVAE